MNIKRSGFCPAAHFDETGGLLIAAVWILGLTSVVVVMFSTRTSTTKPVPIGSTRGPTPVLSGS